MLQGGWCNIMPIPQQQYRFQFQFQFQHQCCREDGGPSHNNITRSDSNSSTNAAGRMVPIPQQYYWIWFQFQHQCCREDGAILRPSHNNNTGSDSNSSPLASPLAADIISNFTHQQCSDSYNILRRITSAPRHRWRHSRSECCNQSDTTRALIHWWRIGLIAFHNLLAEIGCHEGTFFVGSVFMGRVTGKLSSQESNSFCRGGHSCIIVF